MQTLKTFKPNLLDNIDRCVCKHLLNKHLVKLIQNKGTYRLKTYSIHECSYYDCGCRSYEDDFDTFIQKTRTIKEEDEHEEGFVA